MRFQYRVIEFIYATGWMQWSDSIQSKRQCATLPICICVPPSQVRLTRELRVSSVRSALANEEPTIDCNVDDDDHSSKRKLDVPGEAGRVNDRDEIMLDKALGIARQARLDTKVVLQVCERTNATGELNEETPSGSWKMDNGYPAPPHRDRGAQQGKKDERQMG